MSKSLWTRAGATDSNLNIPDQDKARSQRAGFLFCVRAKECPFMASQSDSRTLRLGISAVVAASILFSAKSVFFKLCYRYGTPAVVLQTLRGAFSLPFYLAPFLISRFRPADKRPAALSGKDALI